uniref:Uncharacterized protein n=1 Tax=Sphaerodactylus townsendi TaxID=933632 RepID=A0ACB8F6L3_9SAUR
MATVPFSPEREIFRKSAAENTRASSRLTCSSPTSRWAETESRSATFETDGRHRTPSWSSGGHRGRRASSADPCAGHREHSSGSRGRETGERQRSDDQTAAAPTAKTVFPAQTARCPDDLGEASGAAGNRQETTLTVANRAGDVPNEWSLFSPHQLVVSQQSMTVSWVGKTSFGHMPIEELLSGPGTAELGASVHGNLILHSEFSSNPEQKGE